MLRRVSLSIVVTLAFSIVPLSAFAEDKKDQGYEYWFKDDPLKAATEDGNLPIVKVRATGLRQQLMRPRTAFVPELLKSVENM